MILLLFYLLQCSLGAVIHWFKPKNAKRRPVQNYFHAVLGIAIIGLAIYQVRTGYSDEWPYMTGLGNLPNAVNVLWVFWAIVSAQRDGLNVLTANHSRCSSFRWLTLRGLRCFHVSSDKSAQTRK